jgi:hypothetical protein
MAKTIIEDEQLSTYLLRSWIRVVIFGAIAGLIYWIFVAVIGSFIIEPLACRSTMNASTCVQATPLAGQITTVIIAALSIAGMVRLGVVRPIVIAVASAAVLWNLSAYTEGLFWLEGAVWAVVLYAFAYALFGWLARSTSAAIAVFSSIIIALLIRIALL